MNFRFIGDSNYRELFTLHRAEFEDDLVVGFDLASSVASVKTILDDAEFKPNVVFICSPTNEIALKSKNNTKSREGIIEGVVKDLFNIVNDHGHKHEQTYFVIFQPFLRLDPPWLEAKMPFYTNFVKNTHAHSSPRNVFIGTEVQITLEDLKPDKVHLNSEGMKKLLTCVVADIRTAKDLCANGAQAGGEGTDGTDNVDADMDEAPLSQTRSTRKTPLRKKRSHEESSDDDGKHTKKKKPKSKEDKIDLLLERMMGMDQMLKDLHDDRSSTRDRFDKIEDKMEETILVQENLKEQIESIKQSDNSFSAIIKEDLDAVENASLRDTVIIKRMATDKVIPTERKALSTLILEVGKEILTEIMGNDTCMKYIAPLYFRNDKKTPKEGDRPELPPFKITFRQLPDAILFKEKVIAASKDPTHKLYKCYALNQQNVGTRIRLLLLWGIVDVLKREKKESWVSQGAPKPTLQVKQGTLVKSYSYIEAISGFGERIEKKVIDEATKLASRFYYGNVEKIFIILKD